MRSPTADSPGPQRWRVRLELARRSGRRRRCRRLRRVSGGPGARSIVHDERGLRRRLAHHELLRPGTDVRSARVRAGALLDARSAVRSDVSGVRVRRAAAVRRRRLASAISADGGRHLRPGQVHDVRSRLRRALRDGNDLFQLHQSRKHVRGMHDDVHRQRRLSRRRTSALSERFHRQHIRDVLHGIERRVRHAIESEPGEGRLMMSTRGSHSIVASTVRARRSGPAP